jgi:hypothetical protein
MTPQLGLPQRPSLSSVPYSTGYIDAVLIGGRAKASSTVSKIHFDLADMVPSKRLNAAFDPAEFYTKARAARRTGELAKMTEPGQI